MKGSFMHKADIVIIGASAAEMAISALKNRT